VIILHLYFGYLAAGVSWAASTLAFALPITVAVLAVAGLGLWLGWIMLTTKEVSPTPVEPEKEKSAAETKKK
jgi:hypothetical protein